MTTSALWAAAAVAAGSGVDANQNSRTARNMAADERARLAALMAEKTEVIPDQESLKKARRRSLNEQFRRRGRASTILTDSTETDPLGA